jgi:hypothetical protein
MQAFHPRVSSAKIPSVSFQIGRSVPQWIDICGSLKLSDSGNGIVVLLFLCAGGPNRFRGHQLQFSLHSE